MQYRRWEDFFKLILSSIGALDNIYPVTQNVKSVRLEYTDRFRSNSEDADHFEVISKDSEFLVPVVRNKKTAMHVHSGWFDFETPTIRQLTNINIQVAELNPP